MMQLALFESVIPLEPIHGDAKLTESDWSYSKMGVFWDCPQKFYFTYYGSKKRKATAEPFKDEIIQLSKLTNRYMVQGNIIHQMISTFFKHAKRNELWNFKRLLSFATAIIDDTISFNNAFKKGVEDGIAFPKPVIKELYYDIITEEQFKEEAISTVEACLLNFFESQECASLKLGGMCPSSIIEGSASFKLNESVNINGK